MKPAIVCAPPTQQIDLPAPVFHDDVVVIDAFTGRFTLPSGEAGKAVMTPHMNRWKVIGVLRDESGEILHMAPTTTIASVKSILRGRLMLDPKVCGSLDIFRVEMQR
ncbi:MAG: hypothetical protein ACRC62_37035 [Microcoleus sp.]